MKTAPQPAHTPGPWIATEYSDPRNNSHGFEIGGHPDHNAGLSACVCSGPDCEANAELIVRAVNSHADLLAALRSSYELLADIRHEWPGRCTNEGQGLLSSMRDAIAKATGGDPCDISSGVRSELFRKATQ